MKKALACAVTAAGLAVAACGTSKPAAVTGTETLTSAPLTYAQLMAPVTTFRLAWAGPVTATGTFSPGSASPEKGQEHTFKTTRGNLAVTITAVPEAGNTPVALNAGACRYGQTTVVDFRVDGKASTGSWKGASGTGRVTVEFAYTLPRLDSDHCDLSSSAVPLKKPAPAGSLGGSVSLTLAS